MSVCSPSGMAAPDYADRLNRPPQGGPLTAQQVRAAQQLLSRGLSRLGFNREQIGQVIGVSQRTARRRCNG
jgi:hypothetical protein